MEDYNYISTVLIVSFFEVQYLYNFHSLITATVPDKLRHYLHLIKECRDFEIEIHTHYKKMYSSGPGCGVNLEIATTLYENRFCRENFKNCKVTSPRQ